MLTALVRKDLRLCRLPLIAGLLLLLVPFGISALIISGMPQWQEASRASAWAMLLGTGSYFSVMCSQATVAMLSGNLIAAERADRSAEFLAYLPPSRWQIMGSKLAVLFGCVLAIWAVNLGVGLWATWLAGDAETARAITTGLASRGRLAAIGIASLGGGWWASARLETTGPPVALAFASPLLVLAVLQLAQYMWGWPAPADFGLMYTAGCVLFGGAAFLAGCIHFLRRIEP